MQHQTLQNLVGRADALINAGQFDALMDFYCDDATLVVKPGLNACGKAQIRQAFDAIARHFEHSLRVRQHDLRVIEAGDTALVMAEAVIESKAGRLQRRATYVFRQEADGRWRCAVDNSYGTDLLAFGGGERGGQPMSASTLSASKPLLAGYVESILAAPVYDVAVETPLQVAPQLSQRLGNRVLLKREDPQPVFSFKIRGAYTRVARLSDEQKARGVITASAGNHAQGLALAAQRLGVRAVIVMPRTTPELKVKGVLARGGEALLHRRRLPRCAGPCPATGRARRHDLRPTLRRSGRDRRTGHGGDGDPPPAQRPPRRDLRAGRRRQPDRRDRRLRQAPASGYSRDRRRAGGFQLPAGGAGRRRTGGVGPGRAVRRRGGGGADRRLQLRGLQGPCRRG